MKDGDVKSTLQDSMDESEEIIYSVVEELLRKTGIDASEVNLASLITSNFPPDSVTDMHGCLVTQAA